MKKDKYKKYINYGSGTEGTLLREKLNTIR